MEACRLSDTVQAALLIRRNWLFNIAYSYFLVKSGICLSKQFVFFHKRGSLFVSQTVYVALLIKVLGFKILALALFFEELIRIILLLDLVFE